MAGFSSAESYILYEGALSLTKFVDEDLDFI